MSGSSDQFRVVVGLGNPGVDYENTRHNAGFLVLDRLKDKYNGSDWVRSARGLISNVRIRNKRIALLKPMTYMNLSGRSVAEFLKLNDWLAEETIIVHDDMDIEKDQVRVKFDGGHGGHNGLKSIIDYLGTRSFSRVRVGVGRSPGRNGSVDYVLGTPVNDDMICYQQTIDLAVSAVELMVLENNKSAMDRFNRKKQPDSQE